VTVFVCFPLSFSLPCSLAFFLAQVVVQDVVENAKAQRQADGIDRNLSTDSEIKTQVQTYLINTLKRKITKARVQGGMAQLQQHALTQKRRQRLLKVGTCRATDLHGPAGHCAAAMIRC
jgi:hypothetical protein